MTTCPCSQLCLLVSRQLDVPVDVIRELRWQRTRNRLTRHRRDADAENRDEDADPRRTDRAYRMQGGPSDLVSVPGSTHIEKAQATCRSHANLLAAVSLRGYWRTVDGSAGTSMAPIASIARPRSEISEGLRNDGGASGAAPVEPRLSTLTWPQIPQKMKRAMPHAWHSACTSVLSRRSKSSPMIDVVPPIGGNRAARREGSELAGIRWKWRSTRLSISEMAAEIPLAPVSAIRFRNAAAHALFRGQLTETPWIPAPPAQTAIVRWQRLL